MTKVKQPTIEMQDVLDSVLSETPDVVEFAGKKVEIGWLRKGTRRKFSSIMLKEKDPIKQHVKACAVVILNSWAKIKFIYPFYWRWLYYIKDVNEVDILRVIDTAKKKVQSDAFYLNTMLMTGMMDTMMTMTKEEVKRIQAEQLGERPTL